MLDMMLLRSSTITTTVSSEHYADEVIKLNLLQCPDPEAYIEIVFNYEILE